MATKKDPVESVLKEQRDRQKKKELLIKSKEHIKKLYDEKEWYTIRALLGHHNIHFYVLIGARERGKTFTVQDFVLNKYFNPKSPIYEVPFYWYRLNDIAIQNMLMNNGAKMIEPILYRKYNLDIKVKGDSIFNKGKLLCRAYGLSTAYNNKGAALFDAETFKGCNIIIDECARERGQRKTFDVVYNLKMALENSVRSATKNVKVFLMLNNTEECPELLAMFGFIPLEFGVYRLVRKKCIIDYIPNNAAYNRRRKDSLANQLDNGTGNFTNKVKRDLTLIYKGRLQKPQYIIKFTKDQEDWFTVWDSNVICPYKGEKRKSIAMRRYIDDIFLTEVRDSVIEQNDVRGFRFRNILTQSLFYKALETIKRQ